MSPERVAALAPGVYRLFWITGGQSVAAVGTDQYARVWFAPANWLVVPAYDWAGVLAVSLIERQTYGELPKEGEVAHA